jgi:nucleoside-diphosphate-sugar epimerase
VRLLITGASGFIGRNFVRLALGRGWSILSLGIEPCGLPGVDEEVVEDFASSRAEEALRASGADAILHLAGAGVNPADRDARRIIDTNAILPQRLVGLAAESGIKAFATAGSCSEYAEAPGGVSLAEDAPLETRKLYGATKAAGGILALAAGEASGVSVAVLRLFNVYGPGEGPHRLFPSLARGASSGTPVQLSAGTQERDFVYIDDVCEAFFRTLEASVAGAMGSGPYNVCTGVGSTVRDFAIAAADRLGMDRSMLGFGSIPLRVDDLPRVVGVPDRLGAAID